MDVVHGLAKHAREHPTLVVAATGVTLIAVRLLAASAYDPSTALAVLQAAGTADVAVGTLLTTLPIVPLIALGAVAFWVPASKRTGRAVVRLWAFGVVPALLLLLTPVAPVAVGMFVGLWLATPVYRLLLRDRAEEPKTLMDRFDRRANAAMRWVFAIAAVSSVVLTVAAAIGGATMWLPVEVVTLPNEPPRVGYVLAADTDKTVLLTNGDRTVLHLPRALTRAICRPAGTYEMPLALRWLGADPPDYQDCPAGVP